MILGHLLGRRLHIQQHFFHVFACLFDDFFRQCQSAVRYSDIRRMVNQRSGNADGNHHQQHEVQDEPMVE